MSLALHDPSYWLNRHGRLRVPSPLPNIEGVFEASVLQSNST